MRRLSNILFRPTTVHNLAEKELYEAHRGLLRAQAGLEWAQAIVTYHQTRINRLNAYLEAKNDVKTDPSSPDYRCDTTSGFPVWRVHRAP